MGYTVTLASGRDITLEMSDSSAVIGCNPSVLFSDYGTPRVFQFGARGFFERAIEDMTPSDVVERGVFDNMELIVALGRDGLVTTAALRGAHNDVITVFGGPRVETSRIQAAFANFKYADTPRGMTMIPKARNATTVLAEDVSIVVQGRGVVDILAGPN